MKQTFLFLALLALGSQAARGQYEVIKKLEIPRIHAASVIFTDGFESGNTPALRDADGDGDPDLVFFQPDSTGPTGHDATMRIVTDLKDPDKTIVFELQGNQGLGFQDPGTPFLGFFNIWPSMGKQEGIRSFAFGKEGLYLYTEGVTNPDGRLVQAFTLNRQIYRLISAIDVDDDGLVDFVVFNKDTGMIEIYGSAP